MMTKKRGKEKNKNKCYFLICPSRVLLDVLYPMWRGQLTLSKKETYTYHSSFNWLFNSRNTRKSGKLQRLSCVFDKKQACRRLGYMIENKRRRKREKEVLVHRVLVLFFFAEVVLFCICVGDDADVFSLRDFVSISSSSELSSSLLSSSAACPLITFQANLQIMTSQMHKRHCNAQRSAVRLQAIELSSVGAVKEDEYRMQDHSIAP